MKKNNIKSNTNTNDLESTDCHTSDYEIFKSRVANAVLDYMESQNDSNLIECLDKASIFLSNISIEMEKVFHNQKRVSIDQNGLSEIGDDLFLADQHQSSTAIH